MIRENTDNLTNEEIGKDFRSIQNEKLHSICFGAANNLFSVE